MALLRICRDRRSLGSSQKPSGVLVGHTEGITSVAAKGDGRYIISNGKDQALRLWDLRKMHSSAEFETFADKFYGLHHFDYRSVYMQFAWLCKILIGWNYADTVTIRSPSGLPIPKTAA